MYTKNSNPRHPQYIGYIAVEQDNILSDNSDTSWNLRNTSSAIPELPKIWNISIFNPPFYFGNESITLAMRRQGDEEKKKF